MHAPIVFVGDHLQEDFLLQYLHNRHTPNGNNIYVREVKMFDLRFKKEDEAYVQSLLKRHGGHTGYDKGFTPFKWGLFYKVIKFIGRFFGVRPFKLKEGMGLPELPAVPFCWVPLGVVDDHHINGDEKI